MSTCVCNGWAGLYVKLMVILGSFTAVYLLIWGTEKIFGTKKVIKVLVPKKKQ